MARVEAEFKSTEVRIPPPGPTTTPPVESVLVTNPVDSDIEPEVIAVALPEAAELAPELRVTGGRETVVAAPVMPVVWMAVPKSAQSV